MLRALYLIAVIVLFSACGEQEVPLFTMNFEEEFNVPAGLNTLETHTFVIQDIPSLLETYKSTFNVTDEQIANIRPSRASIQQIFSSLNYDFVERVSVWCVSNEDPSLRKEAFYIDFVPLSQGTDMKLLSGISDFKDIFSENNFDLEVKLKFRQFPPNQTDNIITFSFVANSI
jgi:hypothetical protein